jgi:hypothetical protein
MFSDYLIWRTNGLGFHLTNLVFHLFNCLLVYLITNKVATCGVKATKEDYPDSKKNSGSKSNSESKIRQILAPIFTPSWAFLAALLFGLYPLHPEAIAWITGRVDAVVTTFYLGSFWLYIKWREEQSKVYLGLSMVSFILALFSKEMAVTIPLSLMAWEWYHSERQILQTLKISLIQTSLFWLILLLYFQLRHFALGTFIGGYDNSLLFMPDYKILFTNWLHSIRMTLIPINRTITGDRNIFAIGWYLGLLLTATGLVNAIFSPSGKRKIVFLFALIAISLIPVYKIFAIGDDLESSRLVYLSSSFLCMLFALGLNQLLSSTASKAGIKSSAAKHTVRIKVRVVLSIFYICAFGLLWRNNLVWRKVGYECNAIRNGLESIAQSLPANSHLLLIGLPDQINGAYLCRNAFGGIIQKPQLSRDLTDCIALNTFEPVFPFGFLKDSIEKNVDAIKIFAWSRETQAFLPIATNSANVSSKTQNEQSASNCQYQFARDTINCWNSDFIFFSRSKEEQAKGGSVLRFSNKICGPLSTDNQVQAFNFEQGQIEGEIACLRSLPLWSAGGTGCVYFLKHKHLSNFQIIPASLMMPRIDFNNSGYLGTKGFLHLSSKHPIEKIFCRENQVKHAHHFNLEILRANMFLSPGERNSPYSAMQRLKEVEGAGQTGEIIIKHADFPEQGLYQARLWSVDKHNKHLGLAGDHIVISIDQ